MSRPATGGTGPASEFHRDGRQQSIDTSLKQFRTHVEREPG